jgi:hypothetical protein
MDYSTLSIEEFDAIVTGEICHLALWMEEEINRFIGRYYVSNIFKRNRFITLVLYREGLTFQDKLEILQAMLPIWGDKAPVMNPLIKRIEKFKALRNALIHGREGGRDETDLRIKVDIISRTGKEKSVDITPAVHKKNCEIGEKLLSDLKENLSKLSLDKF